MAGAIRKPFLCTDLSVPPRTVLEWFNRRWAMETTCEESRALDKIGKREANLATLRWNASAWGVPASSRPKALGKVRPFRLADSHGQGCYKARSCRH